MVILVLSLILVGLSILERVIHIKKGKDWDIIRLFIGVLIIITLFLISYFATDTTSGLLYVFFTMCIYLLLAIINRRCHQNWIKNFLSIVDIPLFVYLLLSIIQNILIDFKIIILLLFLIKSIFAYPYKNKNKHDMRQNISFLVGIPIGIAIILFYYKPSDFGTRIMVKQEIVAQKFLEEELGLYGLDIYVDYFNRNLRGEDTVVRAYNSSGISVILIYRNNVIISYDIKN